MLVLAPLRQPSRRQQPAPRGRSQVAAASGARAPHGGGPELTPGTPPGPPLSLPGWPRACQGTPRQLARAAGSMAVAETCASLLCPLLVAVEPAL